MNTIELIEQTGVRALIRVPADRPELHIMQDMDEAFPPGRMRRWFIPCAGSWGTVPTPRAPHTPCPEHPGYALVEMEIGPVLD